MSVVKSPEKFRVSIPTTRTAAPEAVHVSVAFEVDGSWRGNEYALSLARTALVARSLIASATAREVEGPDRDVDFTISDEDGPETYRVSPAFARALGDSLFEAREELENHPPPPQNHTIGSLEVATASGATDEIEVYVKLIVPSLDERRLKFLCATGVWTLDEEASAMADALDAGASTEQLGLSISTRSDGRVALRLHDEIVEEQGKDGELLLACDEARTLAGILRAALVFRDATPPRVAVPPEPFERVVSEGPSSASSEISDEDGVTWLRRILSEIEAIRVGAARRHLLEAFRPVGDVMKNRYSRFVHRRYPIVLDVRLAPASSSGKLKRRGPRDEGTEWLVDPRTGEGFWAEPPPSIPSDDDVIVAVSRPYLGESSTD